MRKFEIIVILLLIIIIGGGLYWLNKDNSISMQQEGKTTLSPTQIKSIEAIGQWEFLSISDEELIDTVRKGLISDDELVRIYYGTLRLGINMREVGTEWLSAEGDTIICTLPPISTGEQVFENVKHFARNGSIIVFHDSLKAEKNMKYALPRSIEWLRNEGYEFAKIPMSHR